MFTKCSCRLRRSLLKCRLRRGRSTTRSRHEGEDERSQVARTKPSRPNEAKSPERSQVGRTKPRRSERSQVARTRPSRPNEANSETPITSRRDNRTSTVALSFCLFPLFFALFLSLFPLFLRRRLFRRCFNALHCNWRQFPIVDALYFCAGRFGRRRSGHGEADASGAGRAKQSPKSNDFTRAPPRPARGQFWQKLLTGITAAISMALLA